MVKHMYVTIKQFLKNLVGNEHNSYSTHDNRYKNTSNRVSQVQVQLVKTNKTACNTVALSRYTCIVMTTSYALYWATGSYDILLNHTLNDVEI